MSSCSTGNEGNTPVDGILLSPCHDAPRFLSPCHDALRRDERLSAPAGERENGGKEELIRKRGDIFPEELCSRLIRGQKTEGRMTKSE